MKRNKIIAIVSILAVILFGTGFKIYADQQAEQERIKKYETVKKLSIKKNDLKYIEEKKLVSTKVIKNYIETKAKLNESLSLEQLNNIEKDLKNSFKTINNDLNKKVNSKKDNSLKKVNKLKAKTKAEKKAKINIKKVLNGKYKTSKENLKNINLLVKKHKALTNQDSKIKALDKKIKKRISKQATNQTVVNPGTNYNSGNNYTQTNPGTNNNGGTNGGNDNSGDNGRPDWYNQGGTQCLPKENGEVNEVCIVW